MIIDFHTHIFPDRIAAQTVAALSKASGTVAYASGTEDGLVHSMDNAGITYSVALSVATNPHKVSRINQSTVFENKNPRLIRFGTMHPDCPDAAEELKRLAEFGCKGIKIHPVYQGVDLDDIRYLRILETAGKLGLIVISHCGNDIGFPGVIHCSPAMALHAIHEVGPVKLVLAHMGGWGCWEEAKVLLAHESVYFDTSFSAGTVQLCSDPTKNADLNLLSAIQLTELIRVFGAERVLFGTDSPWTSQKQAVELIQNSDLSQDEKDKILWKNAKDLLSI